MARMENNDTKKVVNIILIDKQQAVINHSNTIGYSPKQFPAKAGHCPKADSHMLSGESRILSTDKNIIEVPHSEGEYYFDEELIKNYPGINPTNRKGFNIPVKSPGPCPSWEDYDFVDTKVKNKVETLPRPYNVAIKITRIQALEVPLSEFRNLRNESPINEGQLQKSFIIARTNNLSIENFRKNNRKS